jgi:hypothetical protein
MILKKGINRSLFVLLRYNDDNASEYLPYLNHPLEKKGWRKNKLKLVKEFIINKNQNQSIFKLHIT